MAYERDDYRRGGYGRGYVSGERNRSGGDYGRDQNRDRSNYGRYGRDDDGDDRGFFERAGEEIKSWFGDDDDRGDRNYRGGDTPRSGYNQDVRGGRYTDDDGRFGGRDYGAPNYGSPSYQRQGQSGQQHYGRDSGQSSQGGNHDPHYASWRQRQIEALDRDYEEYRREHQSKFENDFGSWRNTRQSQRSMVQQVEEHMEVVGTDGEKVGTVDKVKGDRIILTKNDPEAGGRHHSIPCSWIQSVEGGRVAINKSATEAKAAWKDEERNSAFFGNDGDSNRDSDRDFSGRRGETNLNRAFSGTY